MQGGFCAACGEPVAGGDHRACEQLLALDPPRRCTVCGYRLDVQVFPDGYRASCRECRRRTKRSDLSR